jgi:hypothetical protein
LKKDQKTMCVQCGQFFCLTDSLPEMETAAIDE